MDRRNFLTALLGSGFLATLGGTSVAKEKKQAVIEDSIEVAQYDPDNGRPHSLAGGWTSGDGQHRITLIVQGTSLQGSGADGTYFGAITSELSGYINSPSGRVEMVVSGDLLTASSAEHTQTFYRNR